MKKNKMMRLASFMLVLTLLTTCMISGTFAKYVTEGKGADSARVAKFGVTVESFNGMFSKTYATDDENYTSTYVNSVVSDSDENVVAPGTDGEMAEIVINGTPEVAVEVEYAVSDIYIGNWVDNNGNYYCPITVTVNGAAVYGMNYDSADEFANAIKTVVAAQSESYGAGVPLINEQKHNMDISWSWAFEGNAGQDDVKDTFLGNWAQRGDTHKPEISMEVVCTVTQID